MTIVKVFPTMRFLRVNGNMGRRAIERYRVTLFKFVCLRIKNRNNGTRSKLLGKAMTDSPRLSAEKIRRDMLWAFFAKRNANRVKKMAMQGR